MFCECGVVIRVDDGEFSLCEGYSAEGVAEAEFSVKQEWVNGDSFEPKWYFDFNNERHGAGPGINKGVLQRFLRLQRAATCVPIFG